jgi:tetratricopeptide (TPR) repeat protein
VLRAQPGNGEALHLLGVLAAQVGRADAALELLRKAVAANTRSAAYHNSLGFVLAQCGQRDAAVNTLLRALELDPDFTPAQDNLIAVHRKPEPAQTGEDAAAHKTERSASRTEARLVIGIGTGRSGSTTLARLLQDQHGAKISHERPPRLPWAPSRERLNVHLRCFEQMLATNALVGDVSHWWLPYLRELFETFPALKVIALRRDREETIRSFEKIKGSGQGGINHWYDHHGVGWRRNIWDECYPSYDIEDRAEAIGRYWDEYYATVEEWQAADADRVLCVPVDILNSKEGQDTLFDFLGLRERVYPEPRKYNAGHVADGARLWG